MKYFLHDSNAFQDEKITELYINFGYEGLGLFYTTLEKLAMQEKPVKTDVLKKQLNVGKKLDKCWKFMESLDILSSTNGETFNKQLLKFSEKYQIKSEKNRKRIADWRSNNEKDESVTCYESVRNTPKVKISKDNIIYLPITEEKSGKTLNSIPSKEETVFNTLMESWNVAGCALDVGVSSFRNSTAQKKLLPSCRKFTPHIKKYLNKILKDYTQEDLQIGIENYIKEILNRDPANGYASHRFSFHDFIKQENGFIKFYNK